ncbi:MAG: translation initiation factor [Saprospiraceae bacterium]|nr:translation initiation factor [Saprospiraceae bacterium]
MGKKQNKRRSGFYSTDPDFDGFNVFSEEDDDSAMPSVQSLRVKIEKKGRRGKVVTIIQGYRGPETSLQDLARELKNKCGVGGSAKDGEIILQGMLRDKVIAILRSLGHEAR